MVTIGVLAVQGAYIEHIKKLNSLGVNTREVRLPEDFDGLDGLIIPGGESTAIGKLIDRFALREPISQLARDEKPLWGTCAGLILLAKDIDEDTRGKEQPLLQLMDLQVRRNAFGSQLDSFETTLDVPVLDEHELPAVFIRAPTVSEVGPEVDVLSRLDDGRIVAVRQGSKIGTSFHPELTDSDAFHRWFVELVTAARAERSELAQSTSG
jgi:5'-phosphate synthase pdxT subunit